MNNQKLNQLRANIETQKSLVAYGSSQQHQSVPQLPPKSEQGNRPHKEAINTVNVSMHADATTPGAPKQMRTKSVSAKRQGRTQPNTQDVTYNSAKVNDDTQQGPESAQQTEQRPRTRNQDIRNTKLISSSVDNLKPVTKGLNQTQKLENLKTLGSNLQQNPSLNSKKNNPNSLNSTALFSKS